jgi:hypothetical protein
MNDSTRMDCSAFLNHIEEWIVGMEVPGARDHSRTCADCRGLAEDLGSIRLAAATLLEDDRDISPRVWTALRAQLIEEGLIRTETLRPAISAPGWFDSVFAFIPRPALASAYVGALVVAGFLLSSPVRVQNSPDGWLANTQQSTAVLSAQLDDAERNAVGSLATFSPDVTNDLRRNLTIVDNDIALCEKSVQEEPESEIARDYLYSAYQQKADLLAQISEHGDDGR